MNDDLSTSRRSAGYFPMASNNWKNDIKHFNKRLKEEVNSVSNPFT